MATQETWERELEHALAEASPTQVLGMIRIIQSYLYGFCRTCGTSNDVSGPNRYGCKCFNEDDQDLDKSRS